MYASVTMCSSATESDFCIFFVSLINRIRAGYFFLGGRVKKMDFNLLTLQDLKDNSILASMGGESYTREGFVD